MIIFVAFLYFLATCSARPAVDNVPHNVVTVPPNCPDGQVWVNGQCRDIWLKLLSELDSFREILSNGAHRDSKNVVTAPQNCQPGQQWINGSCRDVWRSGENKNVITVPTNCPPGEEFINGQCREIWRRLPYLEKLLNDFKIILAREVRQVNNQEELPNLDDDANRNVISVPNQCPAGYRPDALGVCREIIE